MFLRFSLSLLLFLTGSATLLPARTDDLANEGKIHIFAFLILIIETIMEKSYMNPDYQAPEAMVVTIGNSNVICASPYNVNDPWAGNTEEEW